MEQKSRINVLRQAVCCYNNLDIGRVPACLCSSFPLPQNEEFDELEWRLAVERRGPVEVFAFLCEWGMMPTLLRHYHIRRPSQLWPKVQAAVPLLDELRAVELSDFSREIHGPRVCAAFQGLRERIGPVSASKVLHVLHPGLFVPWDNKITEFYGFELNQLGYLAFLEDCRGELANLIIESNWSPKELLAAFYEGGWKPATKLLDEMHWAIAYDLPHIYV